MCRYLGRDLGSLLSLDGVHLGVGDTERRVSDPLVVRRGGRASTVDLAEPVAPAGASAVGAYAVGGRRAGQQRSSKVPRR